MPYVLALIVICCDNELLLSLNIVLALIHPQYVTGSQVMAFAVIQQPFANGICNPTAGFVQV
jgi:hypothetical protein